jgi:hypothetical protein
MFVPDPGSEYFIPDPGSERSWIPDPDPHKRIEVFLTQITVSPQIPDPDFFSIPSIPSIKIALDPGSGSATMIFTRNIFPVTASLLTCINHFFGSALVTMRIQIQQFT